MPHKVMKPCAYPGCPRLTEGRYCEVHVTKVNKDYERYERDQVTKQRYGREWRQIRSIYAASHPFCEQCFQAGRLVPTEEIHHKIPLREGGTHEMNNLIALCKSCHSKLHAKRGDRWHRARGESNL